MSLEPDRRDWQDLATIDPYWAVLSQRDRRFGRWSPADFLATGEADVERLLARAGRLGRPAARNSALDFGCGLGRLAPAISRRFGSYGGVDISESMVRQAERLHSSIDNCGFAVAADQSLDRFADDAYDLVVSILVFQHVPVTSTKAYLRSLVRVLKPGGLLIFQLPEHIPWAEKLLYDGRVVAYRGLRGAGLPPDLLHRLRLSPMAMHSVPEGEVVAVITRSGGEVADVDRRGGGIAIRDRVYFVTKEP